MLIASPIYFVIEASARIFFLFCKCFFSVNFQYRLPKACNVYSPTLSRSA
uniref:Uncharacterized protein n=1 Tax=Rhizophora mucronata TaxID=61149 RepID=A0A2P2NWM6_RHIMU